MNKNINNKIISFINNKQKKSSEPPKKNINNSKDYLSNIKQIDHHNKTITKKINKNTYYIKNEISIFKPPFRNNKINNDSLKQSAKNNVKIKIVII